MTRKNFCFLFFLMVFSGQLFAININNYPDVTVLQSNEQGMIIEWRPAQLNVQSVTIDQRSFQQISILEGESVSKPGQPDIPWRTLTIGLPDETPARITVLEAQTRTLENTDLAPMPSGVFDRSGLSNFRYILNDSLYKTAGPLPQSIVRANPPAYFRDLPVQSLLLSPVQYFPASHRLVLYERVKLQITFARKASGTTGAKRKELLDDVARQNILNFEVAQDWRKPLKKALKKTALLPPGPFYKITVKEDGLYKITPSVLETAGIDLNSFTIDQIQMFNNGGHELHYNTRSVYFNPPFTQEIPVLVFDQNNDGKFNGSDYILFYGKHVNSWFYNPLTNDFTYQQHTFATENIYWLSVNGSGGKRMSQTQNLPTSATATADYFYDRFHFEEDLYNLLGSGPDWYGHRFFGQSGGYSNDFSILPKTDAAGATARFRIQFKGGSGILWTDYENYRYEFSILLNNNSVFSRITFNNASRIAFNKDLTDLTWLKSGANTLSINYQGNLDACNVYLDWFELIYPRGLAAEGNQLVIYADENTQAVRYTVTNLSDGVDYYIFDVTDPVNPLVLAADLTAANGALSFNLPPSSSKRMLLVSSLSSSKVKFVTGVTAFTPRVDLLNPANQADHISITHKTFLPYAEEIASLHKGNLTTFVTCMEDIYFYFNSGVPDPTALRNFLRYTRDYWADPAPSFVLFFGDAHYDYRNINLPDTIRVPTWEIYDAGEIDSRCTDDYFVDLDYSGTSRFSSFTPDIAIGRIPVESVLDCERIVEKMHDYHFNSIQDGWQTNITLVADDQYGNNNSSTEYMHQSQSETIAKLPQMRKFILNKVYLSAFPSVPGGFLRIKPEANEALINYLNQGTLIVNYIGHGSPTKWAHEDVFNMDRDYPRIINEGRLCFLVAATCDFGKFDDPHEPSFTEALIWKEKNGIIGALASTRLAYSTQNATLASNFFQNLFPLNQPSNKLGLAKLSALGISSSVNDQKYILFADPAMVLADPKEKIEITEINPDTLKALSKVTVKARVESGNSFNGEAVLLVHDAAYENVRTDNGFSPITLIGPRIFKGEVDVQDGLLTGRFIVPKSIRYVDRPTGRVTIYAHSPESNLSAMGYNDQLLINGSESDVNDQQGPEIDVYFKDQENFTSGDLIPDNTILIVRLKDENGINITGETGHNISLQIDQEAPKDISGFFAYDKNSFQQGKIEYPLTQLKSGEHTIKIQAFDNLNNLNTTEVLIKVAATDNILLTDVVNYPNPFRDQTRFTFQTNVPGADVKIKIYTVTGRLIQELHGVSVMGYNDEIEWDGRDRDGDEIANGVYLYKIILREGNKEKTHIDKLVIMR
ncbi:type IX secretion system sortase PorU [Caldithrix abyssi]